MSESAQVKVRCPSCSKKLGFPAASEGKKARCPACQQTFRVAVSPAAVGSMPAPAATTDLINVACPACGKKLRYPHSARGRQVKCPACQEPFPIETPGVAAAVSGPDSSEEHSLLDILAGAEQSGEALVQQPGLPEGFRAPDMPDPSRATKQSVSSAVPNRGGAQKAVAVGAAMERAYGAMGALVKGCLLSAGGALIGALIWYGIARAFSIELGYVAWAVGLLAGLGMHLGVRNESVIAGLLAAVFAFGGILAGKLMFVAWVLLPELHHERVQEENSIDHQRSILIEQETENVLKTRNIDPDDATEEQEASAAKEAELKVKGLSDSEVRHRYAQQGKSNPNSDSGSDDLATLRQAPTGILVLLVGVLFGFRGLIFVVLGMATAFKVGYNGGNFGGS